MTKRKIKFYYYLTSVLLIANFGFHLATYIPSLRTSNNLLIFIVGVTSLLTFGVAIKSTNHLVNRNQLSEFWTNILSGTPKTVKNFLWILIPYLIFNFIFSLTVLNKGGLNPEIRDGKYVLENKGKVVEEISEEQYFKHKAYEYRGTSGHFILFQYIAFAMLLSALNTEEKNEPQQ